MRCRASARGTTSLEIESLAAHRLNTKSIRDKTSQTTILQQEADLTRHKMHDPRTRRSCTALYQSIQDMPPSTTVASHALLPGAIVGCDASATKAKFISKLRQVTHTLHALKYMDSPRSEFLVVKHCGTQWARYVTTVMPGDGFSQSARCWPGLP